MFKLLLKKVTTILLEGRVLDRILNILYGWPNIGSILDLLGGFVATIVV